MVEKLEQQFKHCLESQPKFQEVEQEVEQEGFDLSNKKQVKKKNKKKPKKDKQDDEDFLLDQLIAEIKVMNDKKEESEKIDIDKVLELYKSRLL